MIKKLVKALKEDYELYYAYQANIAMSFVDECHRFKKRTGNKYLNQEDLHEIANTAAKNFLNLLIKRSDT